MAASVGLAKRSCSRRATNHARDQQAKGFFKCGDSGLESSPSPTQTSCFELARRRIGSGPDPRLRIKESLHPRDFQGPVRQLLKGQHRERQLAIRTPVTLHRQALPARGLAIPVVTAMPVQPAGATPRTTRPVANDTVSSNLDALVKTRTSSQKQFQNPPEPTKLPPRINPPAASLHHHELLRSVTLTQKPFAYPKTRRFWNTQQGRAVTTPEILHSAKTRDSLSSASKTRLS